MTCSPSRMACSLSRAAGRRFPRPVTSANLSEFVKALLARCGDSAPEAALPDRLPEVLENLRREELRRSAETATEETAGETAQKIEERIEECEARLKEIDRRYPELDDDVQAFDASQGKPHLQGFWRHSAVRLLHGVQPRRRDLRHSPCSSRSCGAFVPKTPRNAPRSSAATSTPAGRHGMNVTACRRNVLRCRWNCDAPTSPSARGS